MQLPQSQPHQIPLFPWETSPSPRPPVNVASVPQRSPFRYPGGKTWLIPEIRKWLADFRPAAFYEPFAGGGIVGITVAAENLADHVTLVELDPDVSAVWHTLLSDDAEWLAQRILNFPLDETRVREFLAEPPVSRRERAFLTIVRNRVQHGGILAPGTGLLKNGENGKGIASRWYPETLARRIRNIHTLQDRITFIEGDGLEIMSRNAGNAEAAFFIDPPYTAPGKRAGKRLYACNAVDHEHLFELAATLSGRFMMTYDNAESVRSLAGRYGFASREVAMKNTHHAKMTELLIGPTQHVL